MGMISKNGQQMDGHTVARRLPDEGNSLVVCGSCGNRSLVISGMLVTMASNDSVPPFGSSGFPLVMN